MKSPNLPDGIPVLSRGHHRTPRRGACFMELASVLAGERWSDHPACTHPLLAELARLVNDDTSDHVFHIHTNPFQVVAVNDEPVSDTLWRDTVIVPREGSLTFRSRFLDFTGKTVLHCHMMNHEELGMMQLIEFTE